MTPSCRSLSEGHTTYHQRNPPEATKHPLRTLVPEIPFSPSFSFSLFRLLSHTRALVRSCFSCSFPFSRLLELYSKATHVNNPRVCTPHCCVRTLHAERKKERERDASSLPRARVNRRETNEDLRQCLSSDELARLLAGAVLRTLFGRTAPRA